MDILFRNSDILELEPIKQDDILKLDLSFDSCKTFYKLLSWDCCICGNE